MLINGHEIAIRQDRDGYYFIGEAISKRFLWWTWTVWVNCALFSDTGDLVTFQTEELASIYLQRMRDEGAFEIK